MQRLTYAAATDSGVVRPENEDSVLADPPVFVVADGVGGVSGGAEASAVVIEELAALTGPWADPDQVREAVHSAHQRVAALHEEMPGASSTLCAAVAVHQDGTGSPQWMIVNVGDSRCYLVQQVTDDHGEVTTPPMRRTHQVTVDHSLVQEMVDAGVMDPSDIANHPSRNVITRAVGSPESSQPDTWMVPLEVGQRLLLCTDGLVEAVPFEAIDDVLHEVGEAKEACDRLLSLALSSGARDNVSVIIVDVQEGR